MNMFSPENSDRLVCAKCESRMYHEDDDYGYWWCLKCGARTYERTSPSTAGESGGSHTRTVEQRTWRFVQNTNRRGSGVPMPLFCIWPGCDRAPGRGVPYCGRHQLEYATEWGILPPKWTAMQLGRPIIIEVAYLWDGEYALIQSVRASTTLIPKRAATAFRASFRNQVGKCMWMREALEALGERRPR